MARNTWIWIVSIIIPGLVTLLYFGPKFSFGTDLRFLPRIYSSINFVTAVILILALRSIKKKRIMLHRRLMVTALSLSILFLLLYVIYHSTSESVKYGGEGAIRYVYFTLLISHILLSAIIVPLVLITLNKAIKGDFETHKKWARWTWPIWLYVSITGVIIYLMIAPYY